MKANADSKGHGSKNHVKELAIVALLTEPTIQQSAKKANVSEVTLWRWLQQPDFQTAYKQARREVVSQATAQLQQACTEAVTTLRDVMNNKLSTASARVSAARTVLETAQKSIELEDLVDRVESIERQLAEDTNSIRTTK